jgi:fucose permease
MSEYRRDAATWAAFAALLSFGVLNAGLGPALPYLRATEHISYVAGVLHQVAFAIGGGLAGLLAAASPERPGRLVVIVGGLAGAGAAWLGIGYGGVLPVTAGAAFVVSFLGTSALIRLWAALADIHGPLRAVAMAEGEIWVSLGSIATPLLVGALAATALGWRSSSAAIGLILVAAALACRAVGMPAPRERTEPSLPRTGRRPHPTLVIVVAVVAIEFSLSFWLASYLGDDLHLARRVAVVMVAVLYAANLAGRLLASRLVRRASAARVLGGAFALGLAGLPVLLAATGLAAAAVGLVLTGMAIGAFFPLTSSLHVGASARNADGAVGEVLAAASIGQVFGPVIVAALAQAADLRTGLVTLPVLVVLGALALRAHVAATRRQHAAA